MTKRYGSTAAVEELNLTVRHGEVYGFLGPNGAGKTTTLRMLLGLIAPTSGQLRLLGVAPGHRHLDRVGALIEGPAFYPYLSGRDNLRVLADHAGVSRSRVPTVLAAVDLTGRASDKYAVYSMGMKQRLGLAAALLRDPELLILDEPTNGLDPAGMADMRATIRRLAAEGCTVLLSSHLLAEVEQTCDRVGVINQGQLVTESTVDDLRGGGTLRVRVDPFDRARGHLQSVLGPERVHVNGDSTASAIDLTVDPARAADINEGLVGAGFTVSELRWHEPDLEETFLKLTGGATDAD